MPTSGQQPMDGEKHLQFLTPICDRLVRCGWAAGWTLSADRLWIDFTPEGRAKFLALRGLLRDELGSSDFQPVDATGLIALLKIYRLG